MAKPKVSKGTGEGMSKEDCLALGQKVLSTFTGDELEDYVSEVYSRARGYQDITGVAAIKRAMQEVNKEAMEDLFHQCTATANNVAKFEPKATLIRSGKSDLRNILVPRGKSQGQSLDGAQKAARGTLYDSVFNQEWNQQKEAFIMDRKNDMAIYDALDGKDASPEAKQIAKSIERFRDVRNAEGVRSNSVEITHLSQYKYLDRNHDATKMMNGGENIVERAKKLPSNVLNRLRGKQASNIMAKEAWVNYIKPRLDLEVMFKGSKGVGIDGELNHEYIDKTLGRVYENITTNKSEMFTRSLVANDREAVKRKQRMFLYFKDWRSWGEYNEKYGEGTLIDALMADIRKSGGKIGTADFMGTNPHGMFLDLKYIQQEVQPEIPVEENARVWDKKNEYTFTYLLGANPSSVRPTLTNFLANLRSFITANRAAYITATSITDQSHMLEYIGHYGVDRVKGQMTMLGTLFNNKMADVALPERKIFAKQMAYLLRSHVGFMAKALDSQSIGSWMNHAGEFMFKWLGTKAMDEGNLTSALWLMSDNIARHSHLSFDSIPKEMRTQFEDFNISKEEWNLLRKKTKNRIFSLDNVDSLTDQELRKHHETTDKSIPLTQLRNELYRKVYSMFDVAAQNCILNPTAFSRANIYGMDVPGEYKTEVLRQIMHMKTFSTQYIDRVWRQGFNRNKTVPAKMMFAIRLMAMSMPLAALSTWFYNFSQGKSTDFTDPKFLIDSALPGMGMFLNILDPKKERTDLMFGMARSPSITMIQNMIQAPWSLITGDPKGAAKHFSKAVKYLLPYETIPFLAPFLRDMLGETSYLQPGQRQLFGA